MRYTSLYTESASFFTDPKDIAESGHHQDEPNRGVDKEMDEEDSTKGVKKFWGKVRMN